MDLLTVFAHFDVDGLVAPHVRRYLDALAEVSSRLVVVSSSPLTTGSIAVLAGYGPLIQRDNTGYDFYSWRTGLVDTPGWQDAGSILLANDSMVGPVRPLPDVLSHLDAQGFDHAGITTSDEIQPHVQSYFARFGPRAVASPLFQAFWLGMPEVNDRYWVIRRFELGLSRLMRSEGLSLGAYFQPTRYERSLAQERKAASLGRRAPELLTRTRAALRPPGRVRPADQTLALADRILDDGRLPFIKVSFLRDDPYAVGAEGVLRRCEEVYPREFEGVREYVERIRPQYQARHNRPRRSA